MVSFVYEDEDEDEEKLRLSILYLLRVTQATHCHMIVHMSIIPLNSMLFCSMP